MTTDQVVVYGGNDGTAETYNTVTVDRGDGPGQEQLVQQVGYSTTAVGTLVNDGDSVQVDTTGMAASSFALSGTYDNTAPASVSIERSFDGGTTWTAVKAVWSLSTAAYSISIEPASNLTYLATAPSHGAGLARIRLSESNLDSGGIGVAAFAQPVDPIVHLIAPAATSFPVEIQNTPVPVSVAASDVTLTATVSSFNEGSTGTIAALDGAVTALNANGVMVQISGDLDGALVAEVSLDDATFFTVDSSWLLNLSTGAAAALDPAGGVWLVNIDGPMLRFRVRCSTYNSGTAAVTITVSGT